MMPLSYNQQPQTTLKTTHGEIQSFNPGANIDYGTVESFGNDGRNAFNQYGFF
jgi:hypothetical protein